MLTLALQLCACGSDTLTSNVSVASTALATVRQLIALVMDATSEVLSNDIDQLRQLSGEPKDVVASSSSANRAAAAAALSGAGLPTPAPPNSNGNSNTPSSSPYVVSAGVSGTLRLSSAQDNLPKCAILLVKDLTSFMKDGPGAWIRGILLSSYAFIVY